MNRRQKIIVSVTGIFLVLLLLVGLTYAYFLTQISGNTKDKSISVTTANLALVYDDGNGVIATETAIIPGTTLDAKTFTVKNEGNATSDYVVLIEDVKVTYAETVNDQVAGATTTFVSNDFVYTLTCTSDGEACNGINTETVFPINGGILLGNSIEVGKTHSYTLTVTYKDTGIDQSGDMNKTLEAKVNIADISTMNPYSSDETLLANAIIDNALSVTTQQKEDGYAELLAMPKTTVAASISETYEATGYEVPEDKTMSVSTSYQGYYWTYATEYTVDPTTGKFSLVDAKTCKYSETGCINSLVSAGTDVYVVSTSGSGNSSSSNTAKNSTNLTNIYRITSAPASSSSSITVGYRRIVNMPESTLSATQDDYGTSYYYRGAVKNNYLTFNNMCWRIVRIEGDGAIKIVLADDEAGCSTATLAKTDSAYIGTGDYGYDTSYKADYENSQNRTTSMKYKFNEWFNTNLASVSSKLKTTTVCIGETTNKYDDNGNLLTDAQATSNGYWYYDNYKRLNNDRAASLVCNAQGGRTSSAQIYPLTADEVVFAGGKVGANNFSYYLRENATTGYWWTLSPASFYGYDVAFVVDLNGYVSISHRVDYGGSSLRPAVSLASGAKIASGDGSISNPYTIQ